MRITKEMLKDACRDQVAIFLREWPDGVEVNSATARRAAELGIDLGWAVKHLLPANTQKAYDKAMAPARRAYEEVAVPAWMAYQEAVGPAQSAYQEIVGPARKALDGARPAAFVAACAEGNTGGNA